jgi:hypothetical protein
MAVVAVVAQDVQHSYVDNRRKLDMEGQGPWERRETMRAALKRLGTVSYTCNVSPAAALLGNRDGRSVG